MNSDTPVFAARSAAHPIHATLASFPVAFFTGALLTDIAYARTADIMWANFSAWLLAVGLLMGVLAAAAGIVDLAASRAARRPGWAYVLGNVIVLVIAAFDNLVHSRDAWTSVVPTGLVLSALLAVAVLATSWLGAASIYSQSAGVRRRAVQA